MQSTTIRISEELKSQLSLQGSKEDTYEDIIKRNIRFTEKFSNEAEFAHWFENNYSLCGFDSLKKKTHACPDYIMTRNGKDVRVELEVFSGNFLLHKHDPTKVDLVLCLLKTKELPIKTVEIPSFKYIGIFWKQVGFQISDEQENQIKKLPRSFNFSEKMRTCLDKVLARYEVKQPFAKRLTKTTEV